MTISQLKKGDKFTLSTRPNAPVYIFYNVRWGNLDDEYMYRKINAMQFFSVTNPNTLVFPIY